MATTGAPSWYRNSPSGPLAMNADSYNSFHNGQSFNQYGPGQHPQPTQGQSQQPPPSPAQQSQAQSHAPAPAQQPLPQQQLQQQQQSAQQQRSSTPTAHHHHHQQQQQQQQSQHVQRPGQAHQGQSPPSGGNGAAANYYEPMTTAPYLSSPMVMIPQSGMTGDPFGLQYYTGQSRPPYGAGLTSTMPNLGAPPYGEAGAPHAGGDLSQPSSVLGAGYFQAPPGSQAPGWAPSYFVAGAPFGYNPAYYGSSAGYVGGDSNRHNSAIAPPLYPPYPTSGFPYSVQHDPPLPKKKSKSEQKTFTCYGYGNCRMQFTRHEHLLRHIRKHTGERPYQCHCGKSFSRLDNLRQHAQTVHQNPEDQEANHKMMEDYMKAASEASALNSRERERQRERERLVAAERQSPASVTTPQTRLSINSPHSMDDPEQQYVGGEGNGENQSRKRPTNVIVYPESLSSRRPSDVTVHKNRIRKSWAFHPNTLRYSDEFH